MGINLLLVDLGSPENIGRIIREAYDLGNDNCRVYIFDPRDRLTKNRQEIDLTSIERGSFEKVDDIKEFLDDYDGRKVITEIKSLATPFREFVYQEDDIILLGNENRGYQNKKLELYPGTSLIKDRIIVPMLGKGCKMPDRGKVVSDKHGLYPNISVASAAALVLSEALNQLGYYKRFDLENLRMDD